MEKENLDNLFRESLDEFRQEPDPKVWDRIQASLDKKAGRRKRVLPLWWQLGGAAAALALLLFLLVPGGEEGSLPQNDPITDSPAAQNPIEVLNQVEDKTMESSDDALVVEQAKKRSVSDPGVDQTRQNGSADARQTVALQNKGGQETTEKITDEQRVTELPTAPQVKGVAERSEQQGHGAVLTDDRVVAEVSSIEASSDVTDESEIPETEMAEAEETKAREELLSELQDEPVVKPEDEQDRWAIGPSIAPVFFNGLGDGSPIDQAFVSNDKSGSFNMSYGLQVSYQVNKRLQLRSGMHRVDFGYNTKDIVFSSSLQTSASTQMKNVDYSTSSEYLVVTSQNAIPSKANSAIRNEIAARNTSRSGTMVQEFGYLEVPLELNYAIIDRTLGVHLISGISSLFLVDNTVSLESTSGTTEVGQANNLNDVNFSANIGFGVQYEVSDKIKLQVEPLLKYQLNTFSDTAGEFRPYSIGIYSGIRYKF